MKKYLAFAAVGIVLIGCGTSSKSNDEDTKRLNDNANSNSAPVASAAKKAITAGDWEVGKKDNIDGGVITPGTYIITANADGIMCSWQTVKNFDGTAQSIIAIGIIDPGKTARVVVKSSYAGLSLDGDCLAKKKG